MNNRNLLFGMGAALILLVGLGLGISATAYLLADEPTQVALATAVPATASAESTASAPTLPAPPTVFIPATDTPTPTITPTPSPTAIPTDTPPPTNTATATATPTVTPTATRVGPTAKANEDAGFFAGPGVGFGRLAYYARPNETVVVLGNSDDGLWWHVVSNANSLEGWVSKRFFTTLSGEPGRLPVSAFRATPVAAGVVVSTPSSAAGGSTQAVAYWAFLEGSAQNNKGEGTWRGELLVRVPTGDHDYTFELAKVVKGVTRTVVNEGGMDNYIVTISGMGCGSFVQDFSVRQDGAAMVVKNLYTELTGPVFIQHDCK